VIGRNGEIANRFEPGVKPESDEVVKAIEAEHDGHANDSVQR
jgi:hypothetical protein